MGKYFFVLLLIFNSSFFYSQIRKTNANPKVTDSTSVKSFSQKDNIYRDSLSILIKENNALKDTVKAILETVDNLVEIFNYKKGFNDRNFIKRDFENRFYDPSKEDNWRFDADIELAKVFIYLTKNQDSINKFQNVVSNIEAKKTLFDASLVLSKKPDSAALIISINSLKSIDVKDVINLVVEEKIRLEGNLNKYLTDACNLRKRLAQLNNMSRENTNFPVLLEKLKVEFNYSSYLLSVINGIKKYKVEDSYFDDKFGNCE